MLTHASFMLLCCSLPLLLLLLLLLLVVAVNFICSACVGAVLTCTLCDQRLPHVQAAGAAGIQSARMIWSNCRRAGAHSTAVKVSKPCHAFVGWPNTYPCLSSLITEMHDRSETALLAVAWHCSKVCSKQQWNSIHAQHPHPQTRLCCCWLCS
jgi:hypothetical protein